MFYLTFRKDVDDMNLTELQSLEGIYYSSTNITTIIHDSICHNQ